MPCGNRSPKKQKTKQKLRIKYGFKIKKENASQLSNRFNFQPMHHTQLYFTTLWILQFLRNLVEGKQNWEFFLFWLISYRYVFNLNGLEITLINTKKCTIV